MFRRNFTIKIICPSAVWASILLSMGTGVHAQAQLDTLLDKIDQPQYWQQNPVSTRGLYGQNLSQQSRDVSPNSTGQSWPMPQQRLPAQASFSPGACSRLGLLRSVFGQSQAVQPAQFNQQAPGGSFDLLKYFLGPGDGPKDPQQAMAVARENLQTAIDQGEQAVNSCNSMSGESDKGVRQGLASDAGYHASASREASDRAYAAACSSGSPQVSDIATQARAVADQAQEAANLARSNAGD